MELNKKDQIELANLINELKSTSVSRYPDQALSTIERMSAILDQFKMPTEASPEIKQKLDDLIDQCCEADDPIERQSIVDQISISCNNAW